jgi:peptide/nickel transport system substrate-binding protein
MSLGLASGCPWDAVVVLLYSTEDQFTYEHWDYNFGGVFKDKRLREAFTKCLPRQQIIDNLIKPQNPDAKILQSRFIFPFQKEYSQFETGVGGEAYNTVDIPGAKALLTQAGKIGLPVRIGWRKDPEALNQRRADTVALVKASCDQAGFKVIDSGTPSFFDKEWPAGNWDVDMFAWIGSPTVTGSNDTFKTGGGQNPGKYSNKEVDALLDKLATTLDREGQVAILKQIDTALWTDLATIPLFAHPGIVATTSNAEGVTYNATQA